MGTEEVGEEEESDEDLGRSGRSLSYTEELLPNWAASWVEIPGLSPSKSVWGGLLPSWGGRRGEEDHRHGRQSAWVA